MKTKLKKIFAGLGGAGLLLLTIVVLRAALAGGAFNQAGDEGTAGPTPPLLHFDDPKSPAERLAGAIRIKTVSIEGAPTRAAEFARLHAYLAATFPRTHRALKRESIGEHSLLYTWEAPPAARDSQATRGRDAGVGEAKPILILAHQDVVPVGLDQKWRYPAFSGTIAEGYIWGRGTLDVKGGLIAVFEAIETLLAQGYKPGRTIYLGLGHDEELNGLKGAAVIAEFFRERKITFDFIQDEGMIIADGIVPGVDRPVALIGVAQKGEGSLELTVAGESGHASMPPPHTTVGVLSTAISRIEANPMPASLSGPAQLLFKHLTGDMSFANRLVFANLWLLGPLVETIMTGKDQTNAAVRTTLAATMIRGSNKDNVLPARAVAVINMRIHPRDTIADVVEHVTRVVGDERVRIRVMEGAQEPSRVSSPDSPRYAVFRNSIREVFPEAAVAPALFIAISDTRHFKDLSDNIYRFQPLIMKSEDLPRIHGVDERISIEAYIRYVQFYGQLLRNSA
ncbi:MAG: M20 family peptidase, partial [Leptospirales bacterium]